MNGEKLVTQILPVGLAVILLGLGMSLRVQDFRRILKSPQAISVGLVVQLLALPLLAGLLSRLAGLTPAWAVGMVLLAASPCGATASIFSHLAGGDVALNLTLTAITSLLSGLTLPLMVHFAFQIFSEGQLASVGLPIVRILEVFALICVPVLAGMWLRGRAPSFATRMDRVTRVVSILLLLLLIVAAVVREHERLWLSWQTLGSVVLAFNLSSLSLSYLVSRLVKLSVPQTLSVTLGLGVHNTALAMTVGITILQSSAYAMPSALYSLVMFPTAFGLLGLTRLFGLSGVSSDTPSAAKESASKT